MLLIKDSVCVNEFSNLFVTLVVVNVSSAFLLPLQCFLVAALRPNSKRALEEPTSQN